MDLPEILRRIEQRLDAVGLSAAAASKAAGKSEAIRNLQRAVKDGKRSGITTSTINALAPVLKTSAVWLIAGAGPEDPAEIAGEAEPARLGAALVAANFGGAVEAGSFRPIDDFADDVPTPVFVPRDPDFPSAKLVVFDVVGDSMNALKPRPIFAGDRVVCLDFEASVSRMPFRDGMVVVVEQVTAGGHLRERSVKQIEIYDDRTEFCPRSSNPKHKPIVVPKIRDADDGREVRVIAIVREISNRVPLA